MPPAHRIELVYKKRSKVEDHCKKKKSPTMNQSLKLCSDCQTSDTPLWRNGPLGPKTLCNACGIRYSKRRRMEFNEVVEQSKPAGVICKTEQTKVEELKRKQRKKQEKMMKVLLRRRSDLKVRWKKCTPASFGGNGERDEVAEAACLLLSLSSGLSVQY